MEYGVRVCLARTTLINFYITRLPKMPFKTDLDGAVSSSAVTAVLGHGRRDYGDYFLFGVVLTP